MTDQVQVHRVLNLTKHPVRIEMKDKILTIPPSGYEARVDVTVEHLPELITPDGAIKVIKRNFGVVTMPLQDWKDYEHFIVSSMVLEALREKRVKFAWFKRNFYAPDTGPTAIKKDGRIVAVRRLVAL